MRRILPVLIVSLLVLGACDDSDDDDGGGGGSGNRDDSSAEASVLVFNGEGNNLKAYTAEPPFDTQQVITNAEDDPGGLDINAQICFFADGTRMVAGEDTGQPDPPAGWGIFEVDGDALGDLSARKIGKLTPTYQDSEDSPENYGCGVLSDGRIVTTDIGDQVLGDGNGQLIIWFPPFDRGADGEVGAVPYCKLDVGIATAGGIAVDEEDNLYVASARPPTGGVWRYPGPFPTDDTPEGGCASTDTTGAPMADDVAKELFIPAGDHGLGTPVAVAITDDGNFFVSSVFTGVINEYDAEGAFVRTILSPPEDETIGPESYSTGTPLGIGLGPDGTLYYADIAIVAEPGELPGPGPGGTVRRIVFVDGEPQPPEIIADGLAFPDGIGVRTTGG